MNRVSYQAFNAEIPEGLFVLHKCDNPACVNPDHLFTGSHLDNQRDKAGKERGRKGTLGRPVGVVPLERGRYQANLCWNGGKIYLGTYPTIEEAVMARNKARVARVS